MGRHYKSKGSLINVLLRLALLAVLSIVLLFVFCRMYPEKFSPSVVSRVESITAAADHFRTKAVSLFKRDKDDPKVILGTKPLEKEKKVSPVISKDAKVEGEALAKKTTGKRPILAIVVDDGGNAIDMAKKVASFELPMTWAILPYTRYAKETAAIADKAGIPYLLHLPMQAEIDKDSKEYLVGLGMDRDRISDVTVKALNSLPSPIGINNHRGSLATSKRDIMIPIIDVLKERRLLFLDSRTSGKSVAYKAAKAAGIKALQNRGFLDGTPDKDSIKARFDQIVKTTLKRGDMIVICHFRPSTLLFLEKLNKEYTKLPVRLVTIPEMAEMLKINEDE